MGDPCSYGPNGVPCAAGFVCDTPNCGAGQCQPAPPEDGIKSPVCGCDGITYWNASVAANRAMPVATASACAQPKTCGGFGNLPCPMGATCNHGVMDPGLCGAADLGGSCWYMPAICDPGIGFGPQTRACGAVICQDECELIKSGMTWYPDSGCPK